MALALRRRTGSNGGSRSTWLVYARGPAIAKCSMAPTGVLVGGWAGRGRPVGAAAPIVGRRAAPIVGRRAAPIVGRRPTGKT